jgi:hypothetical protein
MIDLGRLTQLCSDCPQVVPIAGDLTMNGENRHIYRLGYQAAQSFGVKVTKKSQILLQGPSLMTSHILMGNFFPIPINFFLN